VNHVIYAFDKETEALVFEVPVSMDDIEKLRKIMKWASAEDEIYGYDLDSSQIKQLETLLGRDFYNPQYDFQLACYASQ
jgi:hypothetical protein